MNCELDLMLANKVQNAGVELAKEFHDKDVRDNALDDYQIILLPIFNEARSYLDSIAYLCDGGYPLDIKDCSGQEHIGAAVSFTLAIFQHFNLSFELGLEKILMIYKRSIEVRKVSLYIQHFTQISLKRQYQTFNAISGINNRVDN